MVSGNGIDDDSKDDDSKDDDSDEEDSEEDDSDEEDEIWYPDDNVMSILSEELWKKCMRKTKDGKVYYNLEQEYIEAGFVELFSLCPRR